MAKKIQLQDANGNVLHPLTLGECVTMSNGENLDTLMSKSQMFTPTIAQDKSMFKVGTGVDVDYSANVKDGAYESLVFKGKSLVNLAQFEKLFEATPSVLDTQSVMWYGNTSKRYVSLSMFKPNTKYIVKIGSETPSRFRGIYISGLNMPNPNGYYTEHNGVFTTPSTIPTEANMYIKGVTGETITKAEYSKCQILILEYQEGMEDWGIPYFEGLCDSKMPILRNTGKNLFDLSRMNEKVFAGGGSPNIINLTDNSLTTTNNNNATSGYGYVITNLKKGVPYRLTVTNDSVSTGIANFNVGKRDGNNWHEQRIISIPIGNTASRIIYADNSTLNLSVNIMTNGANGQFTAVLKNIQIEEVSSENDLSTTYEDYKTNILRTSEEIVLREVDGVQDTYNPLTGEYTKRIGEVVLDGSENEWEDWSETSFVLRGNYFSDAVEHTATTAPRLKCNNMVAGEGETPRTVRYYRSPTVLWTMVGKNNGETLDQFKTWLSQNPTTIQYILAEPVTTIVKPSTMTPFAYQNGHVIVESGFEGQSLLPEIEYSVVTGRTGQVTQNTKVLRKQEQQIIGLEELLLTQVVQMEYERTLLQFDYELQMMMLG